MDRRDRSTPGPHLAPEGNPASRVLPGQVPPHAVLRALDRWIGWARHCRIDVFVGLQRRIRRHYQAICAALTTGMSNKLIESTNTKTRSIIRRGFGFHSADAVITLVMLTLAGPPTPAPRTSTATE
ncbi:transposase [Streptomyces sp. NPDC048362]|uniref:transposase n=1 Tax=Streptomyces sp. NPDC048362 TaxID=3365539 RepID=UPI0037183358